MKVLIIFISVFLWAFPMKKGDFATIDIYDNAQMKWANKFKIVDVGGLYDTNLIENLKKLHNIKLGYDWMPAIYYYTSGENSPFVKNLYKNRYIETLNPNGPFLHCKENGYTWCRDYYYNFGYEKVIDDKIKFMLSNMKEKGFSGIFFDWASGIYIKEKEYKPIYDNFKKLNPHKDYFKLVSKIYQKLKEKGVFFVTNQAFRKHKYLLPFVKYDMTESYITDTKDIKTEIFVQNRGILDKIQVTNYYPIDNKSLKATLFYINLLTKYKKMYKKYGFKNFIYLNYLAPEYKRMYGIVPLYKEISPKNGIFFSYAMAKLTDNIVYAEVSNNKKLEQNDVYFYDLGKVKGKTYTKLEKGVYIRWYENGFVLASDAFVKDKIIKLNEKRVFYDVYNHKWIKNNIIKLHYHTDDITEKKVPLGRLFIYKGEER